MSTAPQGQALQGQALQGSWLQAAEQFLDPAYRHIRRALELIA
jgi:hypothetical protein